MTIKWRLYILFVQLAILTLGTFAVTGRLVTAEAWYFAGLLAVIINPQLLEPYYPKPADVVANSLLCVALLVVSPRNVARVGWDIFSAILIFAFALGVIAIVLGAGKAPGSFSPIARAARVLAQQASARRLYSVIFWLSIIEFDPSLQTRFWWLVVTWSFIILLGLVNWQNIWATALGRPISVNIEGSIGPSRLLITASEIPQTGSRITLKFGTKSAPAVVLGRIHQGADVWAQVYVENPNQYEDLRKAGIVEMVEAGEEDASFLGVADAGSTDRILRFITTRSLEVGKVVAAQQGDKEILYQITAGRLEELTASRGSQLVVRVDCTQLGIFNPTTLRLERVRWTPDAGAPVRFPKPPTDSVALTIPDGNIRLGSVIGTSVPMFLNWRLACQGHLAILGMTRMGKTSLAVRIADVLSKDRRVVILDQTGEYIGKRNLAKYDKTTDWSTAGLSVLEPRPADEVLPKFADDFFKKISKEAVSEYLKGDPSPRVLVIDEAHQFVPEPAGLGFGSLGRDEAIHFGLLMMQVRKYGIAVILISQRTAVVAKSALSQCENLIVFKSVDQTGLDYLEAVAGEGIRGLLTQLQQGEAVVFGPAISSDGPVAISVDFNS